MMENEATPTPSSIFAGNGSQWSTPPKTSLKPDVWLCAAPPGIWNSGRIETNSEYVQSWRDKGYECTPYWGAPVADDLTTHKLYKTGDCEAPLAIKDRNGEVIIAMCSLCGSAEIDLEGSGLCSPTPEPRERGSEK